MTAFPVKTNKENSAISPLFGKAKYFAFYDGENLSIEENLCNGGGQVVDWFIQKGVDKMVIKEMGIKPYKKTQNSNIKIFYSGDERVLTNDLIEKINSNGLKELDEKEMLSIIKKHESSHTHSH